MAETSAAAVAENEDALRRQAYSAATTRLRNENRPAFDALVKEEMEKRGVKWEPRLTEEQKAEKQMEELLAKHPDLRAKFSEAD